MHEIDEQRFMNQDNIRGKLPQLIKEKATRDYIKYKFRKFLQTYEEKGVKIYIERIREMYEQNR